MKGRRRAKNGCDEEQNEGREGGMGRRIAEEGKLIARNHKGVEFREGRREGRNND